MVPKLTPNCFESRVMRRLNKLLSVLLKWLFVPDNSTITCTISIAKSCHATKRDRVTISNGESFMYKSFWYVLVHR